MTPKTKAPTRAQFDKAIADYETESAKLARLEADRQRDMDKISKKYAQPISETKAVIENAEAIAKGYAEACEGELIPFGKSSVLIGQVQVGKRKLPASLVLCENRSWEEATEALQKSLPHFVEQVPTPDKAALKDALQDKDTGPGVLKKIAAAGVELKTGFKFYVEIKKAS